MQEDEHVTGFTLWYLGFVFFPVVVFLFEDGISISKEHKSLKVSSTYKISSASYSVVYTEQRKYCCLPNPLLGSQAALSPLQLYSYSLVKSSLRTIGKQVNLLHGKKTSTNHHHSLIQEPKTQFP